MTLSRSLRDVVCRRAGRDRPRWLRGGLTVRPRARFGAVAVLVALVVVVLGAGGSGAAARRPLVSNLGESSASVLLTEHFDVAQGFRTGGLGSGYVLESVEVQVVLVSGSAEPVVTLHRDDPDSAPVAALTLAGSLIRNSPNVFDAPEGTVLVPNSTYYVVIGEGGASGYVGVDVTGSGGELAEPGWEVLDRVLRRAAGSGGAFGVEGDGAVRIRVNGEYTAVESLVSNAGQSAGSSESLESYDVAQGFSTGSGHGWALDGIDVVLSEVSDTEELSVTLHADDPAGTAVAVLAAGGSLAVGVNSFSFDVPGGTVLDPDSDYFVVVQGRGHGVGLVSSDGEDSPRRGGWSVHDARHRRAGGSNGAFVEQPVASLGIGVRGAALVPGELSALEVAGRGGDALAWAQGAFDPATTVYSAGVANAVLTVTVTATPELGSTAVITCGNGFTATGSGLCPLVVGDNVLTVDAVSVFGVEKTYRLSVVRAEGSAEPVVRRLVSNIDEYSDGGSLTTVDVDVAQGFRTGALGSGYVLDSIEIRVEFAGRRPDGSRPEPSVTLHRDDPAGAAVATLAPSGSVRPNDAAVFVPSPDGTVVVLEPDSAYYVVVQEDVAADFVAVGVTLSGGEEADPGWEMLDVLIRAADSTGAFEEGSGAVRIRVNGEHTEVEALVGISALGLADSDGNALAWTQGAFDPATAAYSAGVADAVSAVTVTATPEPRSTATITCPDRTATGLCPLEVGANVFTVDVVSPFGVRAYGLYIVRAEPGEPARTAVPIPVPEVSLSFPGLGITDEGVLFFDEDIFSFDVDVSLSEVTPHRVTARVFTADGTARSPADFTAIDQTLVFAPGETSKTVPVEVDNDGLLEHDETFTVSLDAVSAAATLESDASAEVRIDDDDAVNVRIKDGTYQLAEDSRTDDSPCLPPMEDVCKLPEGGIWDGGVVEAKIIMRSPDPEINTAAVPLHVHVVMVDGTAVAGQDYLEDHFTLTLEPGESEVGFRLFAVDDAIREAPRETFSIRLERGSDPRVRVNMRPSTVSIADNDDPPVVSVEPATATEGADLLIPVTKDVWSIHDVLVPFTLAGTASAGEDYVLKTASPLKIRAGQRLEHIRVATVADGVSEGAETLTVTLDTPTDEFGDPTNEASLGTATATGTIADAAPAGVTVTPQALRVDEAGRDTYEYEVRLGKAPAAGETVTVTPRPGSAVSVVPASLEFTVSDWDLLQTVTVTAAHDADRRDDVVTVAHAVSGGGYGSAPSLRVTVVDDDRTAPGAPRSLTATAGNGEVTLRWAAPADDGGLPITAYDYQLNGSEYWRHLPGTATSHTVKALTNGPTYTFRVRARNEMGEGEKTGEVSAKPEESLRPPTGGGGGGGGLSGGGGGGGGGLSGGGGGGGLSGGGGGGGSPEPEPVMFSDVAADAWFGPAVAHIAAAGVTTGYPDGTYRPDELVSRAHTAVFLVRALGLQPVAAPEGRFEDVAADSSYAGHVERIAELAITVGCNPDGTLYCPRHPVGRSQMALFLKRALELPDAEVDEPSFDDIPAGHYAHGAIEAIKAAGITLGCRSDPPLFCGTGSVTRAQMAAFLSRALEYLDNP